MPSRRGKLKYRDVVGGKQNQNAKRQKSHGFRKNEKKNPNFRKRKSDSADVKDKNDFKRRKFHNADNKFIQEKRAKTQPIMQQIQNQLQSESEEEDDPMTKLRKLLGIYKEPTAIDTDYENSEEEDQSADDSTGASTSKVKKPSKKEDSMAGSTSKVKKSSEKEDSMAASTSKVKKSSEKEDSMAASTSKVKKSSKKEDSMTASTSKVKKSSKKTSEDEDESTNEDSIGASTSKVKKPCKKTSDEVIDTDDDDADSDTAREPQEENEDETTISDTELDLETEKEEENIENSEDPFVKHLYYDLHNSLLDSLQATPIKVDVHSESWPRLGHLCIEIPQGEDQQDVETPMLYLEEKKVFAAPGKIPSRVQPDVKPASIMIKPQIEGNLRKANKALLNKSGNKIFTQLQSELFSILNNYQDLFFSERTFSNAEEIRYVYCLHAVNHLLKTRTKVLHHNAKMSNKDDMPPDEFKDQGFVRPKILFLVPFRDSAYKIVCTLIDILLKEDKGNVSNKKRFTDEFTGHELTMPKKNPKPDDYSQLFTGNTDDDFKIGLAVTRKTLKLYTNFYSSDIIIASPLGLRTLIGAEGEPERDYDFLASLELLISDQTEIFLMQNYDHVYHIFDHLHLQCKDSHDTNVFRVRNWCLKGWSKYYRQTLIFSSVMMPEINSLYTRRCLNYAGKIRIENDIECGAISEVYVRIPHIFRKFCTSSYRESIDDRLNFLIHRVLPQQQDVLMKQTLIYVPNYFDYIMVRNHFKREDVSFVQICEYSKEAKIAKARDMFFHGDVHFLLYSGRYHFFNRIRVKGIRHIVFYQPPTFPHFYGEMCNLMQEYYMNKKIGCMSNMSVTTIYCKFDLFQLSGVVGTNKAVNLLKSEQDVHSIVTGV